MRTDEPSSSSQQLNTENSQTLTHSSQVTRLAEQHEDEPSSTRPKIEYQRGELRAAGDHSEAPSSSRPRTSPQDSEMTIATAIKRPCKVITKRGQEIQVQTNEDNQELRLDDPILKEAMLQYFPEDKLKKGMQKE